MNLDFLSDGSRMALQLSKQEAQRLNHEYVGTEHLIIGLMKCHDDIVDRLVFFYGVPLGAIRNELEQVVQSRTQLPRAFPLTPRVISILEIAKNEADGLGTTGHVEPVHILLGVLQESNGIAATILKKLGLPEAKYVRALATELLRIAPPKARQHETLTLPGGTPIEVRQVLTLDQFMAASLTPSGEVVTFYRTNTGVIQVKK